MLRCNDICKVSNHALAEFRLGQCEQRPAWVWGGGILPLRHGRYGKTALMWVSPYIMLSYQWKKGSLNWSDIRDQVSIVLSHIKKVLNEIATLTHAYSHSYTHIPRMHVWEWVCRVWQVGHDWLGQQEISSWQHFSLKGSLSSGRTCVSLFLCVYTVRISVCVFVYLCDCIADVANCQWALEDLRVSHPITFYKWALTQAPSDINKHWDTHTHPGA